MLQQEPGDFKMPVVDRRVQGMAAGAMPSSGRLGSAPRSSSSFTISRCPLAAAFFRGARADIISDVFRNTIGERRILVEQVPHSLQIAELAAVQMS